VLDARARRRIWRLALAALAMGALLFSAQGLIMPYTHGGWFLRLGAMSALVCAGICVYGLATLLLGAFTREDLGLLRRRRAPTKE